MPAGHDEDLDGVDDACDGCPHVADPGQENADGDGVNDACDLTPDQPSEWIVFFDPFVTRLPSWSFTGVQPIYDGIDSMQLGSTLATSQAFLAGPPGIDLYQWAGRAGPGGGGTRILSIYAAEQGSAEYYCELFDNGTMGKFAFTYTYDGMMFTAASSSPAQRPLEHRDLVFRLVHLPTGVGCDTSWPMSMGVTAPLPAGIAPIKVGVGALGLELRLDYFIQIRLR